MKIFSSYRAHKQYVNANADDAELQLSRAAMTRIFFRNFFKNDAA